MATLAPSKTRRRDWLRARLAKLEMKPYRTGRGLTRAEEERYGRYLAEYESLTTEK